MFNKLGVLHETSYRQDITVKTFKNLMRDLFSIKSIGSFFSGEFAHFHSCKAVSSTKQFKNCWEDEFWFKEICKPKLEFSVLEHREFNVTCSLRYVVLGDILERISIIDGLRYSGKPTTMPHESCKWNRSNRLRYQLSFRHSHNVPVENIS